MRKIHTVCIVLSLCAALAVLAGCTPGMEEPQPAQAPQQSIAAQPMPELTPSSTPTPTPTPTPVPTPEPTPVPTPEVVDLASKTLPDLQVFLNRTPSIDRGYFSNGREFQFINMPFDAWKTVEQELVALLQEPRYQLELIESGSEEKASLWTTYYNFRYAGTASDITLLKDKDDIRSAHIHLKVYGYKSNQSFAVRLVLCDAFELEDPGSRTTQNVGKSNVGGGGSYTPDSGNTFTPEASRLDCLTCRGDGDCNTCGGDGYTGFGDAKAGCRTCHGNGKCTACGGTGKR